MLDNTTADFESPIGEPDNVHSQSLTDALERDPIAMARGIVNTIRSSQLRRVEFREIVETGNRRNRWKDEHGHVQEIATLSLIRDSPIRWGSTFLMINRFLTLRSVSISPMVSPFAKLTMISSSLFRYLWHPILWTRSSRANLRHMNGPS